MGGVELYVHLNRPPVRHRLVIIISWVIIVQFTLPAIMFVDNDGAIKTAY